MESTALAINLANLVVDETVVANASAITVPDVEDDDRESLDKEDLDKNPVYRFVRKLARYWTACHHIVRELVSLHRSGSPFTITIETIPFTITTSTPEIENEYYDLASFFAERLATKLGTLESKAINALRDKWTRNWRKANLFLHAEMQMALFYSLNPQLNPIQGFIGVSKKCCWCCDFVLKSVPSLPQGWKLMSPPRTLQSAPDPMNPRLQRYTPHATGNPISFSVDGTHGHKYPLWSFPDPAKYAIPHQLDDETLRKVRGRFALVHEDLQNALLGQIRSILPELMKEEVESDSSGLSGDTSVDHKTKMILYDRTWRLYPRSEN